MNGPIDKSTAYFAHTLPGVTDMAQWERLEDHLREVADRAAKYASAFRARDWGYVAGLWHDIGKYSDQFQNYLRKAGGADAHIEDLSKVDHATAGAKHAYGMIPGWGRLLAYIIAGHHSGLADAAGSPSSLISRLDKNIGSYAKAQDAFLNPGVSVGRPELVYDANSQSVAFQMAIFTRMVSPVSSTPIFWRPRSLCPLTGKPCVPNTPPRSARCWQV